MPPRACADLPWRILLKAASLSLSSLSKADILEVFESTEYRDAVAMLKAESVKIREVEGG